MQPLPDLRFYAVAGSRERPWPVAQKIFSRDKIQCNAAAVLWTWIDRCSRTAGRRSGLWLWEAGPAMPGTKLLPLRQLGGILNMNMGDSVYVQARQGVETAEIK